jgi:site-specific DNA-methyltransferase (adenine-specific)
LPGAAQGASRKDSAQWGVELRTPGGSRGRLRRATSTSAFGVGRRESHDASEFYRRFDAPVLSDDDEVCPPGDRCNLDRLHLGDIRDLRTTFQPSSVGLVVTSPPYYSGKEYEAAIGEGHVPASYTGYLAMLRDVFATCKDALEPGGRIAVNVANLGRKPYRSLSADIIRILEEDLGMLLRGEIIWQKARGATGSCAWGSYQMPLDPVLRDVTERVVIASKGRFDRAVPPRERARRGLPSEGTIFRDEFMEATLDLWEMAPESARRVNHPAPFPVELPQRLIDLYTYKGDIVLDPFMGSGTTAIAALRTDRHYLGYDTDPDYVATALERIGAERRRLDEEAERAAPPSRPLLPATPAPADPDEGFQARGVREGRRAKEVAKWALRAHGFEIDGEEERLPAGVTVNFIARDQGGERWCVDVSGAFTSTRAGLLRTDALWKALGKAAVLKEATPGVRYLLLTTEKPPPKSAGGKALAVVTGRTKAKLVYDVIEMTREEDLARLAVYGRGRRRAGR